MEVILERPLLTTAQQPMGKYKQMYELFVHGFKHLVTLSMLQLNVTQLDTMSI